MQHTKKGYWEINALRVKNIQLIILRWGFCAFLFASIQNKMMELSLFIHRKNVLFSIAVL